jgi:hypothetical protein
MKKLMFYLLFISVPISGYCDTLDFYHVYLNDSLLGQYNSISDKPSIILKQKELKESDILTVQYGTDNPCVECVYILSVLIEVKEKTPEVETTEDFGELSIPIRDLLYFEKKYEINDYNFYYEVRTKSSLHNTSVYLFELKII